MINVGVIGCGYWGPNLIRNFSENSSTNVSYACDLDESRLKLVKSRNPCIRTTCDYKDILKDDNIHLIAIATPVSTHYNLAAAAFRAGKHVLVAKPLAASVSKASKLIKLSCAKNLKLFVDQTFIFTGAIKKIKEIISCGELGDMYYFDSVRVNLGLFQHDVNVIWDLAPHDFSVMDYLIDQKPIQVSAVGANRVHNRIEDIAYVTVKFEGGLIAHFHVNWMSPVKVRRIIIGASSKMIVFDDLKPDEKVKIYDKGISIMNAQKDTIYKNLIEYRTGDMYSPKLDRTEALQVEVTHIVECLEHDTEPISGGESGLRVVKLLEACDRSIRKGGVLITL